VSFWRATADDRAEADSRRRRVGRTPYVIFACAVPLAGVAGAVRDANASHAILILAFVVIAVGAVLALWRGYGSRS
jgi:hypothetical protein